MKLFSRSQLISKIDEFLHSLYLRFFNKSLLQTMNKLINFEQLQLHESAPTISIAIPAISSFIRPWGGYQPGGGGGEGGVLWYFHTYLGSAHLWGFKILNFNIFWGFQKNKYFLEYEDFVDIFFGSSQNGASLRVISMRFRVFFKVKVRNWDIFLGC